MVHTELEKENPDSLPAVHNDAATYRAKIGGSRVLAVQHATSKALTLHSIARVGPAMAVWHTHVISYSVVPIKRPCPDKRPLPFFQTKCFSKI